MMGPRSSWLRTLICLCLCLNLAVAGLLNPIRRDDPSSITAAPPAPSSTSGQDGTSTSVPKSRATDSSSEASGISKASVTTETSAASSVPSTFSPSPTAVGGTTSLNSTFLNNGTVSAGKLPLHPRITPGWGISGVLLIGTGLVHALVGIKSKWWHAYFSAAALGSLGTTVLILYVMSPPVRDAIQGAYVVAAACTGMILGGAAIVFRDTTESVGCLLGGFCLSMWLLCLREGGLLPQTGPKVAFIAVLTVAAFALYFFRWTRAYALIGCIAFSGATALVLGIDCFSRAGLKEFWAYIWNLNANLFPLGTDTYPLTKGMKVELAVIILITLAGVVSQMKLWMIVSEQRARRDIERADRERALQDEEENAGRRIEEENSRERIEWERAYGDGEPAARSRGSADSGVGDVESEKRLRNKRAVITTTSTSPRTPSPANEELEMTGITPDEFEARPRNLVLEGPGTALIHRAEDGVMVVRVAHDATPNEHAIDESIGEKSWAVESEGQPETVEHPWRTSNTPLPMSHAAPFQFGFAAPQDEGYERSSVATFADEDNDVRSVVCSRRNSAVKRLSASSAKLMRSLSQRSRGDKAEMSEDAGESQEELVAASTYSQRDDNDSVAGNLDDLSVADSDIDTIRDRENGNGNTHQIVKMGSDPTKEDREQDAEVPSLKSQGHEPSSNLADKPEEKAAQTAEMAPMGVPNTTEAEDVEAFTPGPPTNASDQVAKADANSTDKGAGQSSPGQSRSEKECDESSRRPGSHVSSDSAPVSLSRGNLPRALSRVAMSYRTNEWAKHLSLADTPDPEDLHQVAGFAEESSPEPIVDEEPAPLNIEELQQTAENATPPPAAPRSASAMSSYSQVQTLPRNTSRTSLHSTASALEPYRSVSASLLRRASAVYAQPIAEEDDAETGPSAGLTESTDSAGVSTNPCPTPPEPTATGSFSSRLPVPGVIPYYSSPQTLIGKRDMFLRSKSQPSFYIPNSTPSPTSESPVPTPPTGSSRHRSSDGSSIYNPASRSASRASLDAVQDADDVPLSYRRELIRRPSLASQNGLYNNHYSYSQDSSSPSPTPPSGPAATAESVPFNSHQPRRQSSAAPEALRRARLAGFRSSVAADLRAGSPIVRRHSNANLAGANAPPATSGNGPVLSSYGRDADVRRSVDAQRSAMLAAKEKEAREKAMRRLEKERGDREFEVRMRRGDLMEAHREAMRRLQGGVKG